MKTITFLTLALTIFSCQTYETDNEALNHLIIKADGHELDQTLTLWFDEFTENQAMGFDMYQADHLASKKTILATK